MQPGSRIAHFEILAPLGAGGMGEVYRARDTRLGRDVAIKVLPAEFAADPERLRRFELEARAVAALSHPNVLAIFDVGTDEGSPYLVTELLEGESLRERLQAGPLTGEEPHLLFGHAGTVMSVAVSPDGRTIACGSDDGTIRLWPMPGLSESPLHTLPHGELVAKLRSLTNLRAVRDPASDTGWKIEIGPFPGWAKVPEWQP